MLKENVLCGDVYKSLEKIPAVYSLRNTLNGKYYIGETMNLKRRMEEYFHSSNRVKVDRIIHKAIEKYGLENFLFEYYYLPSFKKEDLLQLEEEMIRRYGSLTPNGYNVCKRGNDCVGIKFTKETRKKMSKSKSREVHQYAPLSGEYIKTFDSVDNAAKEVGGNPPNISLVAGGKRKSAHGYIWSFVKLEKVKPLKRIGVTNPKPIHQYSLEGDYIRTFESVSEAATSVGGKASNLCVICNGKHVSSHGYIWSYEKLPKINSPKIIYQYSKSGDFIRKYRSLKEAANSTNLCKSTISSACNGHRKSAGGYVWFRGNTHLDKTPSIG